MTGVLFPRQLPPSGAEGGRPGKFENLRVVYSRPEERFDRIVVLARLMFGVAGAGIAMRDGDHAFIKAAIGLPPTDSADGDALARLALSATGTKVIEEREPAGRLGVLARQQAIRF